MVKIQNSASHAIGINLTVKLSPKVLGNLKRNHLLAQGSIDSKLATKVQGIIKYGEVYYYFLFFTPQPALRRFNVPLESCQNAMEF